jgi:hypothetical protein
MDLTVNVGPQGVALGDGTDTKLRGGRTGDGIFSELHPRYFEQMRSGRKWHVANQAAQAVSVALATTYTGLLLYNPVNSGKVIVPTKVKFALSVAQVAASTIGLLEGFAATGGVTTGTTPIATRSNQIGNASTAVALAYSAATITTPVYSVQFYDAFTAGAFGAPQPPVDLEGILGLLPGAFLGIAALTAVTGLGFFSWEEVDLPL